MFPCRLFAALMVPVVCGKHNLAWLLPLSAGVFLLLDTASALRQITQLSQSLARNATLTDRIVPEVGQDTVPSERRFAVSRAAFDSQFTVQLNASWGLDRLDQAPLPLDTHFKFPNVGSSVSVYILDSGILASHAEFGTLSPDGSSTVPQTRAQEIYTVPQTDVFSDHGARDGAGTNASGSGPMDQCLGHGTHIASLVGGVTFGVAKKVSLKSVRVLACDGSTSAIAMVEALEWLGAHAQLPAIALMAVAQTGHFPSLEHAVERFASCSACMKYDVCALVLCVCSSCLLIFGPTSSPNCTSNQVKFHSNCPQLRKETAFIKPKKCRQNKEASLYPS
jgi:hypothetical protein